jgi:hypothetical protein
MFFRSLFYERTILGHLERVEQLPPDVQVSHAWWTREAWLEDSVPAKDEAA